MHNAIVKHMSSNNFCKKDFWNGQKQRKEQYSKIVAAAKIWLQNHLKADNFLEAWESFDKHETDWFSANDWEAHCVEEASKWYSASLHYAICPLLLKWTLSAQLQQRKESTQFAWLQQFIQVLL